MVRPLCGASFIAYFFNFLQPIIIAGFAAFIGVVIAYEFNNYFLNDVLFALVFLFFWVFLSAHFNTELYKLMKSYFKKNNSH